MLVDGSALHGLAMLTEVRARLEAIHKAGGAIQGVYTWFKPDRLAEDGTVLEDGGPLAVVVLRRDGSTLRGDVVALCDTRDDADAIAQYAQEFFFLKERQSAKQSAK